MDDNELWKEYKTAQQDRRQKRLPVRTAQILSLREKGHTVKRMTEYQYRIDGYLDVYPIHNRYHNIKTGKRGGYKDIVEFLHGKV